MSKKMSKKLEIISHVENNVMNRQTSLADLLQRFIQAQDVSPSSKGTYSRQARQFIFWLDDTGRTDRLSTLVREDILEYKRWLSTSGKTPATVSGYLTLVRKFFTWLETEKIYPNIARGVKGLKKPKGFRKDCLVPTQIREALDYFDRSTLEGLRDHALFNLMVRTGLRTVEVSRAAIEDIRQQTGEAVLWIQGKGRDEKDDFVLLLEDTLKPLQEYLSRRGETSEEAPLFASMARKNYGQAMTTRSIRRIVKEAFRLIGLDSKRISAHSLRHTAVSLAVKGGASLHQAQAMARHTDPRTTQVYFHNADRISQGAERFIQI